MSHLVLVIYQLLYNIVDYFGIAFSILYHIFISYYIKIEKLNKIYEKQIAIFPHTIDYNTKTTTENHTDVQA